MYYIVPASFASSAMQSKHGSGTQTAGGETGTPQAQASRQPRLGKRDTFYWFAAGLILVLGALVRFYRVGDQIILDDEWHALNVVQNTGYAFIFSHLGHADHCIPLALLYEWFSHTIGLSEFTMRLPSLVAGVLIIAAFPLLMRPWLSRDERVMTAALLALSPFLINFSRVARPYSLLTLLSGCSLPLAWRWWKSERWGFGLAWYFAAVLAAWLNPVSLAIATAPFLWFGIEGIIAGVKKAIGARCVGWSSWAWLWW